MDSLNSGHKNAVQLYRIHGKHLDENQHLQCCSFTNNEVW